MKPRVFLLAAMAVVGVTSTVRAQAASIADSSATVAASNSAAAPHVAVASAIDAQPVAMHRVATTQSLDAAMAQTHAGMGQAKAMMGVGIAGFIAGALIGGSSGNVIMVASAVIGLYGLYEYLQ